MAALPNGVDSGNLVPVGSPAPLPPLGINAMCPEGRFCDSTVCPDLHPCPACPRPANWHPLAVFGTIRSLITGNEIRAPFCGVHQPQQFANPLPRPGAVESGPASGSGAELKDDPGTVRCSYGSKCTSGSCLLLHPCSRCAPGRWKPVSEFGVATQAHSSAKVGERYRTCTYHRGQHQRARKKQAKREAASPSDTKRLVDKNAMHAAKVAQAMAAAENAQRGGGPHASLPPPSLQPSLPNQPDLGRLAPGPAGPGKRGPHDMPDAAPPPVGFPLPSNAQPHPRPGAPVGMRITSASDHPGPAFHPHIHAPNGHPFPPHPHLQRGRISGPGLGPTAPPPQNINVNPLPGPPLGVPHLPSLGTVPTVRALPPLPGSVLGPVPGSIPGPTPGPRAPGPGAASVPPVRPPPRERSLSPNSKRMQLGTSPNPPPATRKWNSAHYRSRSRDRGRGSDAQLQSPSSARASPAPAPASAPRILAGEPSI